MIFPSSSFIMDSMNKEKPFNCICGAGEKCRWSDDRKSILRISDGKPHIHLDDQIDKTKIKGPNPQDPKLPEYQKVHFEVWTFAYETAKEIHSGTDSESMKSRNILAQVFYKKCFDAKIHGVRQKQP